MKHVGRIHSNDPQTALNFLGSGVTVAFTDLEFILLVFSCLFLVFFATPSLRKAGFGGDKNFLFAALLSIEVLVFTLIPYSLDIFHDARTVVTYLLLGLVSFAFLLFGAAPFVGTIVVRYNLRDRLEALWNALTKQFLGARVSLFLAVLVLVNFCLTNLASYFLFNHLPHIDDSIAQYFHAKIFSLGSLTVPSPPLPHFFQLSHVINNGQWYSQYPPGHTFFLMLGLFIDAPWIINPLFGSLTIIPIYYLGKEIYGETIGRISALLALLSPFLIFMSSEFMNHTTAMFFFTIFLLFFVRALRTGEGLHGLVAGVALGWFVTMRPYSAFALSFPFLAYGAYAGIKRFREIRNALVSFAFSLFVFLGILLLFNTLTNGHPLVFGFDVLWGEKVRPGFGNSAWGPGHTPLRGLFQTFSNLSGVNKYLFEWPVPSLLFVALLFMSHTRNRWDYLLLAGFGSIVLAYFFYWFQDWCFGPRFYYESACLLILLTARGMQTLPDLLHKMNVIFDRSRIHLMTFVVVVAFFAFGYTANIPALTRIYGNHYWNVGPRSLNIVKKAGIRHAVVFTRASYGEVFPANLPLLDGDIIFVMDRGAENRRLMELFKGYEYYRLTQAELVRIEP